MQCELIPLFEDHKTAKEMIEALEVKYSAKSKTHIQLLLEEFNGIYMEEGYYLIIHANNIALLAKKLSVLGNTTIDKM